VGREVGGRVWGTFGIALEMSLRKIRNKKKRFAYRKKKTDLPIEQSVDHVLN
jgi:hypothetical protein